MTALRAGLVLLAALAGTVLWPAGLAEAGVRPDLLLLAAVAAGLAGEGNLGALVGVAGGLAAAPLTLEPFGFDAALLGAAGMAAAKVRTMVRADRPALQAALAGSLGLLSSLARLVRLEAAGGGSEALGMIPAALAAAAATAAAAPAVLFVLDGLGAFRPRRTGPGRTSLV